MPTTIMLDASRVDAKGILKIQLKVDKVKGPVDLNMLQNQCANFLAAIFVPMEEPQP
jgi:hypothetical protein